jgi:hypothetical protein
MTSGSCHSRLAAFYLVDVVFERLQLLVESSLLDQCAFEEAAHVPCFADEQTEEADALRHETRCPAGNSQEPDRTRMTA